MKRQLAVFLIALFLTGLMGLVYQARVLADLARLYQAPVNAVGTQLILKPTTVQESSQILPEARRVIQHRLEMLHLSKPYQVTIQDDYLELILPEDRNTPYIVNIISSIGEVDFIDGTSSPPLGERIQVGPYARPNRHIYRGLFTGQEVEVVRPPDSANGQIFYQLTLGPAAAERFADFAAQQPRAYTCMVVDGRVVSCSRMYHQLGQEVEILPELGGGTVVSLADMAVFLDSGPLPVSFDVSIE